MTTQSRVLSLCHTLLSCPGLKTGVTTRPFSTVLTRPLRAGHQAIVSTSQTRTKFWGLFGGLKKLNEQRKSPRKRLDGKYEAEMAVESLKAATSRLPFMYRHLANFLIPIVGKMVGGAISTWRQSAVAVDSVIGRVLVSDEVVSVVGSPVKIVQKTSISSTATAFSHGVGLGKAGEKVVNATMSTSAAVKGAAETGFDVLRKTTGRTKPNESQYSGNSFEWASSTFQYDRSDGDPNLSSFTTYDSSNSSQDENRSTISVTLHVRGPRGEAIVEASGRLLSEEEANQREERRMSQLNNVSEAEIVGESTSKKSTSFFSDFFGSGEKAKQDTPVAEFDEDADAEAEFRRRVELDRLRVLSVGDREVIREKVY